MGLVCELMGHVTVTLSTWKKNSAYQHQRCNRCGQEHYVCKYEGRILKADADGQRILKQMMDNKQFSKDCHIHSLFQAVERQYPFNFIKREAGFERLMKEYGLVTRPACPVILFMAGLWNVKPVKDNRKRNAETDVNAMQCKKKPSNKGRNKMGNTPSDPSAETGIVYVPLNGKKETDSGNSDKEGETNHYAGSIENISDTSGSLKANEKIKDDQFIARRIAKYTRKMLYHEQLEQYERAAIFRDKIKALSGERG